MIKNITRVFSVFWNYKYIITLSSFLVWMMFFDKQSYFYQQKLDNELKALENDTLFYSREIKAASEKLEELKGSKKAMEKLAREKYLMKKDNEDVFVIVPENPIETEGEK